MSVNHLKQWFLNCLHCVPPNFVPQQGSGHHEWLETILIVWTFFVFLYQIQYL